MSRGRSSSSTSPGSRACRSDSPRSGGGSAPRRVDTLNAAFAGLLDVAYRYGGELLKFGGDALLLFYDGDDHAVRAATAAFRDARPPEQIGRPTPAVRVTLRMSVGVHSGPFEFFLVGSSHRELVVAGPAATRGPSRWRAWPPRARSS